MSFITNVWNKWIGRAPPRGTGLLLGVRVVDGVPSRRQYSISELRRAEHVVILGKTGTGKTSLIKAMLAGDIRHGRGFLVIDLHGDLTPFVLRRIADQEQRTGRDLSLQTVVLNPADPHASVGLNILESSHSLAPLVSEVVAVFRRRWQLDHFGARTEELLRNTLWVLAENGLTLAEVAPFLIDLGFRARLVQRCSNAEVQAYFRERYEQLSDAMQAVTREPILNKVSAFTTDPAIRHIVGQRNALNLTQAMDQSRWIILRLAKADLGENSETLASLILARFQNAVFTRRTRTLFTIYADEVQNLVGSGNTFEHLVSESRKHSISFTSANQHLSQYSPQIRAALLSAGTAVFFRASPEDAPFIARALDGGQAIERRLKELPNRHFLIRSGSDQVVEVQAIEVSQNAIATASLVARSNSQWARPRQEIEAEIIDGRQRSINAKAGKEVLEEWI